MIIPNPGEGGAVEVSERRGREAFLRPGGMPALVVNTNGGVMAQGRPSDSRCINPVVGGGWAYF